MTNDSAYKRWYWRQTPEERKIYNKKRAEKSRERQKKYYQKNKSVLVRNSILRQKTVGRDAHIASVMRYYYRHRDHCMEYKRQYYIIQNI